MLRAFCVQTSCLSSSTRFRSPSTAQDARMPCGKMPMKENNQPFNEQEHTSSRAPLQRLSLSASRACNSRVCGCWCECVVLMCVRVCMRVRACRRQANLGVIRAKELTVGASLLFQFLLHLFILSNQTQTTQTYSQQFKEIMTRSSSIQSHSTMCTYILLSFFSLTNRSRSSFSLDSSATYVMT